jgi:hypothetical protein
MTTRTSPVTLLDALDDPHLFAPAFHPTASWSAWRTVLKSLFALPPSSEDLTRYRTHTGRETWPSSPAREAWLIIGRRGGKSRIAALVAVYLATFRDYRPHLAPGERATIMLVAADRKQARTCMRYVVGLLDAIPMLSAMIDRRRTEAIDLDNRVTLEIHTASFRTTRGYSIAALVADELAFWPSDETAANPDVEILNAIRPAMATIPGSLLLAISSPYARKGALWSAYRQHWGRDGDPVLIWQAETRAMNPLIDDAIVAGAYAEDPASAAAEYGAQFRTDVETFISREVIESLVIPGRRELPRVPSAGYRAFTDPSGGSGTDSFTLAIGHAEMRDGRRIAVLDAVREIRPPFSPESTVRELATLLRTYGITEVTGDRFAGEWPREAFRHHGVTYLVAETSKSDLYVNALPALNSRSLELLDHPRLVAQLCGLERRTARGGRDSIDHPPSGHDDLANCVAGVLADLLVHRTTPDGWRLPLLGTAYYGASFNGWSHREPPGLPPPRPPRGTRWT